MTKIQIIKTMKCPSDKKFDSVHKKLQECSNIIVDKLELEFSCKLRAENPSDTVNGSVTILHEDSKHIIDIVFYDNKSYVAQRPISGCAPTHDHPECANAWQVIVSNSIGHEETGF